MAFPPSKGKKNRRKESQELSLNSMMDMMTIILLFLLKSMSTTGALIRPSPYLDLPYSIQDMAPKKAIAILVTTSGVKEDMESEPRIISDQYEMMNPENVVLPGLEKYLVEHRDLRDRIGKFRGEITIQCDKNVTYDWLLKVINTCGQAEFVTIDFVVIKVKPEVG